MHLSKTSIGGTTGKTAVAAALAGGVILTNTDNVAIFHDANYINSVGNIVNGTEAANFYMGEPFVNALKGIPGNVGGTTVLDPRLQSIAIRYVGATSGSGQTAAVGTTAPGNQYGMKVGATDGSAQTDAVALGIGSRYAYSQVDRARLVKRTSPMFIVTAAQTNLLLAEAVLRGYITGVAATYYINGIKAHMDQMASYDPASAVLAADRDAYVAANPLDADVSIGGTAMKQIGYQYWIASFLHGHEAWANLRRTGFPPLTPNTFVGDIPAGTFINRITYPPAEILVNPNVGAAITSIGGDNLATKVWWAK
jgi:hypothetical protein